MVQCVRPSVLECYQIERRPESNFSEVRPFGIGVVRACQLLNLESYFIAPSHETVIIHLQSRPDETGRIEPLSLVT